MSNQLVAVSDIEKMAGAIAKSGFFGMKTIEQAMALMFIAQAEGKHPATAAQEYHVIQGKPALKADAMMARFQAAGGRVEWLAYTDTEVRGKFSHASGGTVEISWTIDMAKKANLTGKDTWKNYPRQMLRARVISEGIRTVYPGVAVGVYTPEEVQDFDNGVIIDNANAQSPTDTSPYNVDQSKPATIFKTATLRNTFHANVKQSLTNALTVEELNTIIELNKARFTQMRASGDERDAMAVDDLHNAYRLMLVRLKEPVNMAPKDDDLNNDLSEEEYMKERFNAATAAN